MSVFGNGIIACYARTREEMEKIQDAGKICFTLNEDSVNIPALNISFACHPTIAEKLKNLDCNDVVEFYDDVHFHVYYCASSNDNCLVVTNHCNSNCIMCPCSEKQRRDSSFESIDHICTIIRMFPSDLMHLTITGGEPTLVGRAFFQIAKTLNECLSNASYTVLTNGRTFSNYGYLQELISLMPRNVLYAIPLHASCPDVHDMITQAKGSFRQTVAGIKNLISLGQKLEIRVVVTKLNVADIPNLCRFIIDAFPYQFSVHFIATEMCGAAAINKDIVWLEYREAFDAIRPHILDLMEHGIDVRLYNFPLCKVDRSYWGLCARSITDYKISYLNDCKSCSVRDVCGGVFRSTLNLTGMKLVPIKGERDA